MMIGIFSKKEMYTPVLTPHSFIVKFQIITFCFDIKSYKVDLEQCLNTIMEWCF